MFFCVCVWCCLAIKCFNVIVVGGGGVGVCVCVLGFFAVPSSVPTS